MTAPLLQALLEGFYALCGLLALDAAVRAWRTGLGGRGTGLFWGLFGLLFLCGGLLPPALVGALLLVLGGLSALGRVRPVGAIAPSPARKPPGRLLLIPALALGASAFLLALLAPGEPRGGLVGLGAGALFAALLALLVTRARPAELLQENARMLGLMGPAGILPQLLAALGALFAAAGVGGVIAQALSGLLAPGARLAGAAAYCLGMALFTAVMGNAFAAFAVITAGIGIPFVLDQGADPALAGLLGLTAGYCGTLLTPMAANFNVVPAALLETASRQRVILAQLPVALALLAAHIALMYFYAF